jgi:hypothetical protein
MGQAGKAKNIEIYEWPQYLHLLGNCKGQSQASSASV